MSAMNVNKGQVELPMDTNEAARRILYILEKLFLVNSPTLGPIISGLNAGKQFLDTAQGSANSSTATAITGNRPTRGSFVFVNMDGSSTIYLGNSAGVTTLSGLPIAPGASVPIDFTGVLFGIADSGNPKWAVLETYN